MLKKGSQTLKITQVYYHGQNNKRNSIPILTNLTIKLSLGFKTILVDYFNNYLHRKKQYSNKIMFCINAPNNTQFAQLTVQPQNKHPITLNPFSFLIGQALRISLTAFTYQAVRKGKICQPQDKPKECQIIQIEQDQNIIFSEEKNSIRHSQTEKEETKQREQAQIVSRREKSNSNNQIQVAKQRDPAEKLRVFETKNVKIIQEKLPQNNIDIEENQEDLQKLTIIPQFGISNLEMERKLQNILKRQVTDWKYIVKKQKREIRRLKA